MKKPRDSHLGFRMDKETHDKLFYIAEYEGRTGSGQILYLIRRCRRPETGNRRYRNGRAYGMGRKR